jgi:cell wall-associated NlpC family hydrolase
MSGTEGSSQSPSEPRGKARHRLWSLSLAISAMLLGITFAPPAGAGWGSNASVRVTAASVSTTAAAATPARCSWGTCWVAVSVTTLWVRPWYPRSIDGPALSNPAYPGTWAASMSYAQKLWLASGDYGKVNTQALYGTKVKVIKHWVAADGTRWTKVAVPSQPTPKDTRGYPGWVPTRQLTSTAPATATTTAVVRPRTAWLWSSWASTGVAGYRVMKVSYGTRFPVMQATSTYVKVALIGGRRVALPRSAVKLHLAGTTWGATRDKVVADAKQFRRLQYLWAGTSGFGYDCSGFTYSIYRAFGMRLPRDADRQFVHGTWVPRNSLRPGDLVFYRSYAGGPIGHVGMYVGSGNIIDSPQTGQAVRIEPVSSHPYYAGARRYL